MAMCPKRFSSPNPLKIEMTIPERVKSKYSIKITIESYDDFEVFYWVGYLGAKIEERYGLKPEVLILP